MAKSQVLIELKGDFTTMGDVEALQENDKE
jgi:hypothetical protein